MTKSSEKLRAPGTAGWHCSCGARNVVTIRTRDDLRAAACQACGRSAELTLEVAPVKRIPVLLRCERCQRTFQLLVAYPIAATVKADWEASHARRCQGAPAAKPPGGAERLGKITSSVSVPTHGEGRGNG